MDRTDDNSPSGRSALSASSSPMRRVFSHDCVRRPLRSSRSGRRAAYRNLVQPPEEAAWLGLSLGGPTPSSSSSDEECEDDDDDIPSCKASKFSSVANRNKLEANRRRLSLPQPRSSTSLDASHHSVDLSLTGPARTNGDDLNEGIFGADMAMLPAPHGRLRFGPMLNLAVLALLFVATVADVAFDLRNARLFGKGGSGGGGGGSYGNANNADYKFFYDDLSTETIVPPSRSRLGGGSVHHHSTGKGGKSRPRKVGLGSAMIGSVTTALSPILPFAGGVDLRRGEHWGLRKGDGDDVAAESVAPSAAAGWFASSYKLSGWLWSSSQEGDDGAAESADDAASKSYASRLVVGVPRGGGAGASTKNGASAKANNKQKSKAKRGTKQRQQRDAVLAASEPYLSTDDIADLTLGDVALAFRYAIESGREGFDAETFRSTGNDGEPLDERTVRLIDAMDEVAARSRGPNVLPASTSRPTTNVDDDAAEDSDDSPTQHPLPSAAGYGDVDALQFCAAMRLLAEWRVIRQVPEGYKGYAVGMGLGHKDVVQNVAKIEAAVHDLIDLRLEEHEDDEGEMERRWDETSCANADDGEEAPTCEAGANTKRKGERPTPPAGPRSPTLREVLQYEIDDGVQVASKLPRLKEKSAGMGLLWVRRQLHYQTEIFHNMKLIPSLYQDAIEAVKAAYSEVYDRYHGWAVQKIFNYSFQAAPDVDVIYRHMNPRKLKEVTLAAMNGDVDDVDKGYDESEVRFASAVTKAAVVVEEEEESTVTEAVMGTSSTGLDEDTVASTISADSSNSSAFEIDGTIDDLDQASILEDAKVPEANHRTPSSNPWVRFGSHVASEWDKIAHHVGGEWDKLAQHVGGEWDKLAHHVGGECDKLGRHIGGEWDKMASNVGRLFHHGKDGGRARSASPTDIRGGGPRKSALSGDDLERYLSEQMERDAQRHIVRYLSVARPLLDDLAGLFDELNMDDPTKV